MSLHQPTRLFIHIDAAVPLPLSSDTCGTLKRWRGYNLHNMQRLGAAISGRSTSVLMLQKFPMTKGHHKLAETGVCIGFSHLFCELERWHWLSFKGFEPCDYGGPLKEFYKKAIHGTSLCCDLPYDREKAHQVSCCSLKALRTSMQFKFIRSDPRLVRSCLHGPILICKAAEAQETN